MATNNYLPQIDYTSRDYTSIREDMIDLIPNFAPLWTNRDPADFGITLIELFAYMGDLMNYYIDRSANEAFITTATQRDTVLQLALLLGYKATDGIPSTVTLTFTNATDSDITVPALSKVANTTISNGITTQIYFETNEELIVPANDTATVTATQGETVSDELVATSDGTAAQSYILNQHPVINDSIQVTIGTVQYIKVDYLIDHGSYEPVFSSYTNSDGYTFITFGDGVSGRIPPSSLPITATYRVGGGDSGNVPANSITTLVKFPNTTLPAGLTVVNQDGPATGGADPEATDLVRYNAPRAMKALNRAVSLTDYAALAVQVSGVAKAIAVADTFSSVTLYVKPYGDTGLDNVGDPSAIFNTIATAVIAFLTDKAPANTTITLQPPVYVPVNITATVTLLPQYRQKQVNYDVNAALQRLLNINNVFFHDYITLQEVMTTITNISGVQSVQLQKLVRDDKDITVVMTAKSYSIATNTATITTDATHTIKVGQTIMVDTDVATLNGTFVVTAVSSNTFSYVLVATTASGTTTGSATVLTVEDIVCGTPEIPEAGTYSITVTGGIVD